MEKVTLSMMEDSSINSEELEQIREDLRDLKNEFYTELYTKNSIEFIEDNWISRFFNNFYPYIFFPVSIALLTIFLSILLYRDVVVPIETGNFRVETFLSKLFLN